MQSYTVSNSADNTVRVKFAEDDESYTDGADDNATLGVVVEAQCSCCSSWVHRATLWAIEVAGYPNPDEGLAFLHHAGALDAWISPADARQVPGYLGQVARELLDEGGRQGGT